MHYSAVNILCNTIFEGCARIFFEGQKPIWEVSRLRKMISACLMVFVRPRFWEQRTIGQLLPGPRGYEPVYAEKPVYYSIVGVCGMVVVYRSFPADKSTAG